MKKEKNDKVKWLNGYLALFLAAVLVIGTGGLVYGTQDTGDSDVEVTAEGVAPEIQFDDAGEEGGLASDIAFQATDVEFNVVIYSPGQSEAIEQVDFWMNATAYESDPYELDGDAATQVTATLQDDELQWDNAGTHHYENDELWSTDVDSVASDELGVQTFTVNYNDEQAAEMWRYGDTGDWDIEVNLVPADGYEHSEAAEWQHDDDDTSVQSEITIHWIEGGEATGEPGQLLEAGDFSVVTNEGGSDLDTPQILVTANSNWDLTFDEGYSLSHVDESGYAIDGDDTSGGYDGTLYDLTDQSPSFEGEHSVDYQVDIPAGSLAGTYTTNEVDLNHLSTEEAVPVTHTLNNADTA